MSDIISGVAMFLMYITIVISYFTALITSFEEGNATMFVIDLLIAPVGVIHGFLIIIGVA